MNGEVDVGTAVDRDSGLRRLVELQYERNDIRFPRGTFRVPRRTTVEVFPGTRRYPRVANRVLWREGERRLSREDTNTRRAFKSKG